MCLGVVVLISWTGKGVGEFWMKGNRGGILYEDTPKVLILLGGCVKVPVLQNLGEEILQENNQLWLFETLMQSLL